MQDTNGWRNSGRSLRPVVYTSRLMTMTMRFSRKGPAAAGGKPFSEERVPIGHLEERSGQPTAEPFLQFLPILPASKRCCHLTKRRGKVSLAISRRFGVDAQRREAKLSKYMYTDGIVPLHE